MVYSSRGDAGVVLRRRRKSLLWSEALRDDGFVVNMSAHRFSRSTVSVRGQSPWCSDPAFRVRFAASEPADSPFLPVTLAARYCRARRPIPGYRRRVMFRKRRASL